MSILQLQRRIAEAGRIRIGQQVDAGRGKTRPAKLDTFRLTSADKLRIEQAAEVYGGAVSEWTAPAGKQWQVITKADALEVIVPPSDLAFSQAYELWNAGGCLRRCDGVEDAISGGPCRCDAEARECVPHTRLSVMLRDLPGLGVWRLDTSGYYAAVELASAVEIIQIAAGRGALLPARLRLEQRSVKRIDGGKAQTLRFAVPVLDIEISPAQLLAGGSQPIGLEEATAERPKLTPVPPLTLPGPTIAEQSAPPPERPKRSNAAPELPASGRSRRARTEQPVSEPAEPEQEPAGADEAPAPATRPRRVAQEGDADYWMKRVHAIAAERGMDHDAVRLVAAAVLSIEPGADFSMSSLVEAELQAVDELLRTLPESITGSTDADLDAVSSWYWPQVNEKGIDSWEAVDAIAVAATGKQPDTLSVAEWVAWTVRLAHGEYDASQGAA